MRRAKRNGAGEKLISPVLAKRSIFRSGYFVSPANRSSRRVEPPCLSKPYPAEHPPHEPVALAHSREYIHGSPVDEPKVSYVERNLHL